MAVNRDMANGVAVAIKSSSERIVRRSHGRIGLACIVEVVRQPEVKTLAVEALVYKLGKGIHVVGVLDEVRCLFGAVTFKAETGVVDLEDGCGYIAKIAYAKHIYGIFSRINAAPGRQPQPVVDAFGEGDGRVVLAVGNGYHRR